jgi:putative addiction module killer protein
VRLDRLAAGNAGDVEAVGKGVSELRIHFGSGYRVYYKQQGDTVTILCAGTKDSQDADIKNAKAIANCLEG